MHYCFMSLGQWENSASLVRVRELGAALLKKGIRVSYLVDDAWSNRDFKKFPEGSNIEWVIPSAGLKQFSARRAILPGAGAWPPRQPQVSYLIGARTVAQDLVRRRGWPAEHIARIHVAS